MSSIFITNFTQHAEVQACLRQLEAKREKDGLIISDVIDSEGHQYVNLVQKGGGVLGVALIGYTYILEQMGIRFIRLAGTSAGAINTALMTVIGAEKDAETATVKGNKKKAKSEDILQAMISLDFFKLVDGLPVARWLIKNFVSHADFGKKIFKWLKAIAFILVISTLLSLILLSLRYYVQQLFLLARIVFIATLACYAIVTILGVYTAYLIKRLKDAGFGINPGNYFLNWIEDRLKENHAHSVSDLINIAETPVDDLRLREGIPGNLNGLEGDVTFIASELVTQNKIEFPKMWCLFRKDKNDLNPAGFIRSSMAIPLFFESYFIRNIPCADNEIKEAWITQLGETEPPSEARFVDGGILSNFPINLFYNPAVVGQPRLPSLGIDLDDTIGPDEFFAQDHPNQLMEANRNAAGAAKSISDTNDAGMNSKSWSLGGYLYRIFNTIRFYYDKDFLIKNAFYRKGIGTVPMKDFGWLNFFLSDADKIEMFVLGARAATRFLLDFDWESYKNQRQQMQEKLADPTV